MIRTRSSHQHRFKDYLCILSIIEELSAAAACTTKKITGGKLTGSGRFVHKLSEEQMSVRISTLQQEKQEQTLFSTAGEHITISELTHHTRRT